MVYYKSLHGVHTSFRSNGTSNHCYFYYEKFNIRHYVITSFANLTIQIACLLEPCSSSIHIITFSFSMKVSCVLFQTTRLQFVLCTFTILILGRRKCCSCMAGTAIAPLATSALQKWARFLSCPNTSITQLLFLFPFFFWF